MWYTNEKLNNYDKVLVAYVNKRLSNGFESELFKDKGVALNNRGVAFEIAFFNKSLNNSGLHGVSNGDGLYKGENVELKYVTKKTKASMALQGTNCKYTLIAFNDGKKIEIRKILTNNIIVQSGHISYQNNNLIGEVVEVFKA